MLSTLSFVSFPSLAVHCSLAGVQPASGYAWSNKAIQAFTEIVQGDSSTQVILNAKVVEHHWREDESEPVQLELYLHGSGGQSVAALMTEQGYATKKCIEKSRITDTTPPREQVAGSVPTVSCSPSTSLPSLPIPTVKLPRTPEFPVMITHTNSVTEFYLQIFNKEESKALFQLMDDVNIYCSSAREFVPSQLPVIGDLSLAQFTDGNGYRAFVVQMFGRGRSYEVYFLYFGNCSEVDVSQMRPICDKFLSMPAQAVKASLYGVPARSYYNK